MSDSARSSPTRAAARPRVLLTGPMEAEAEQMLLAVADVTLATDTSFDALRRQVRDADVLVVRSPLPPDLLDHAPRLRGIVRNGVGVDMIPVEAATARGLPVANVPGSNRDAVAEHAMLTMGLLARRLHEQDRLLQARHLTEGEACGWDVARELSDHATELGGRALGIVGLGAIGTRIAEIAHHGYRMKVSGVSGRTTPAAAFVTLRPLESLLADCDVLVLACPLTAETRHLMNRERLALMRPGSMLVNVSRGAVIDERALGEALHAGRPAAAALDVFEQQPLATDHPLRRCPRVLLTPHTAGLTVESRRRMSLGAARATLSLLRGEPPAHVVNPQVLERWAWRR